MVNYRARVEVRINGQPFEAADNDFWGKDVPSSVPGSQVSAFSATRLVDLR